MVEYNPITGKRRRLPRAFLPRKKRNTLSSTPAAVMHSNEALKAMELYIAGAQLHLSFLTYLLAALGPESPELSVLGPVLIVGGSYLLSKAMRMIQLDSELMDIDDVDIENAGFRKDLVGITLDSFENDDECQDKTRFTKEGIRLLCDALPCGEHIYLYYNPNNDRQYYKFLTEELLIYTLRRMSTARKHKDLCDVEFGGCSKRWGAGYNCMVNIMNNHFGPLIGPDAISIWQNHFEGFSEVLRQYYMKPKIKKDQDGNVIEYIEVQFPINEGDFNIFGIVDCTVYEICRPGSGPQNAEEWSPRTENWYVKQRAFYDGYHRGMEACLKILTVCLPNGMTGAIYGPTSGRDNDIELFRLSHLDVVMRDIMLDVYGGDVYCIYGDAIFAGYWTCLRTQHHAPPGEELTPQQEEENDQMKKIRESVEWSYARAESLWPLLTTKYHQKLEVNSGRVFAETRVMYFLTNCVVCLMEGSTMTGERGFRCVPPTLDEYLSMLPVDNGE